MPLKFKTALEVKLRNLEHLLEKGLILAKNKRFEESEAAFRDATTLEPRCAAAHYGLSIVLNRLGRREEAAESIVQAVRLDASYADAYFEGTDVLQSAFRKSVRACFRPSSKMVGMRR
jgi:Flp pilus assembly protein TadD